MSSILKQRLIDIANGFTKYGLWKGGGSGGSSALSELTDVKLSNLQANDILKYNGSVWVNSDNLHEYSTEEKIVGKWIDGKYIYEQTFSINLSVGTTQKTIHNIDKLIDYFGSADLGGSYRPIPFTQNGNTNKLIINEVYNGQLFIVSAWSAYVEMTIQYTKTE